MWSAAAANDQNGVQQTLGTGTSIAISSLAPGSYLITASATDPGGLQGIAQVGITVQAPCVQFAKILPEPGAKIHQLLQLDATQSYDSCGRQLKYLWFFSSDTSLEGPTFLAQANTAGNTNATPVLNLQEFDVIIISLQVCVVGTNECSTAPNPQAGIWDYGRVYEGASI